MIAQISIKRFIPGIIWFVVVLVLICLPKTDIPTLHGWFHAIYGDKWVHAGMFGILAWLFMLPVKKATTLVLSTQRNYFILILMAVIAWGYITECIQRLVPGRSYDLADWAADTAGALIAYGIVRFKSASSKNV